jgi:hypothetical protein
VASGVSTAVAASEAAGTARAVSALLKLEGPAFPWPFLFPRLAVPFPID